MQELPIGIQNFRMMRRENLLYVDKTAQLMRLVQNGRRYFLARPRRFGKSLTVSTLEAMFSGWSDLFSGLAAEAWVEEQRVHPCPVIRFDMSGLGVREPDELNDALNEELLNIAEDLDVQIRISSSSGMTCRNLVRTLRRERGQVVILIDEYDALILNSIHDPEKAAEMRRELRVFYSALKSCDEYIRFMFITGISKFTKVGVFSSLNTLEDITLDDQYSDIVGYTQKELESCLADRIDSMAQKMYISRDELLHRLQAYYDGFSFDGNTRLYNPFSILQCLKKYEFSNYWYESGSSSFIVEYMKKYGIKNPDEYRHTIVKSDFISSQEIERTDPSSFLFQSGYLTIEKKQEGILTLDYPNREVMDSIASMYLTLVYKVEGFALLGNRIWDSLRKGDIQNTVQLYNTALSGIPYDDFSGNRNEFWYRSLFIMLLRGAGLIAYCEPHTSDGRADVVLPFSDLVIIIEFKFAKLSSEVLKKKKEGIQQIDIKKYAKVYDISERNIISACLVADDEKREVVV